MPPIAMSLSSKGLHLLKEFEKLGPNVRNNLIYAYICTAGELTIGWGHVIGAADVGRYFPGLTVAQAKAVCSAAQADPEKHAAALYAACKPLTIAQADALLAKDIKRFVDAVNRRLLAWKVSVDQNFFDALVSLAYNAGEGSLDGTIRTRLIAGDIDGAILWLPMFCLTNIEKGGKVLRNVPVTGLTLRRFSEVWLALTGEVWRVGPTKASQRPDMDKFAEGVRQRMAAKGKRSPLPYPRNRLENQVA